MRKVYKNIVLNQSIELGLKTVERESVPRVRIPVSPPLTLAETDDGPFRGPFFFLFQRGLAVASALRRLA